MATHTSSSIPVAVDGDGSRTAQYFRTLRDKITSFPVIAGPFRNDRDMATQVLRHVFTPSKRSRFGTSVSPVTFDISDVFLSSTNPMNSFIDVSSASHSQEAKLYIHIGVQPNNSPHFGTITVFGSAFILAYIIQRDYKSIRDELQSKYPKLTHRWPNELIVVVSLDLVDTAPDNAQKIERGDGLQYQKSHRNTNAHQQFLPDYLELMSKLESCFNVEYTRTNQYDLMSSPHFHDALLEVLSNERELSVELAPERESLALRRACPIEGCGIAEKHGIRNQYHLQGPYTTISFWCPDHGYHRVSLSEPDEIKTLEMNTPMRNLLRTRVYARDTEDSRKDPETPQRLHMRVTGADYAGPYQEQLLLRQLLRLPNYIPPVIFYSPLITDWAGSKISKSLYVKNGAYKYLEQIGMDWVLSYQRMKERGIDIEKIFEMIKGWMCNPNEFFRPHTIDSLHLLDIINLVDGCKIDPDDEQLLIHDGEVHHPLGGGSYIFEKKGPVLIAFARYLGIISPDTHFFRNPEPPDAIPVNEQNPCVTSIHIDFTHDDPNVGAMINTILAFEFGRAFIDEPCIPCTKVEVVVHLDNMDNEGPLCTFLDECVEHTKVTYHIETEEEILRSPSTFSVLRTILEDEYVFEELKSSALTPVISHPCPIEGCGVFNELSSTNPYRIEDTTITFTFECNTHGLHHATLDNEGSPCSIKLSQPLYRLVRTIAFAQETVHSRYEHTSAAEDSSTHVHMQIQGWENAGDTQEQKLWRALLLLDDPAIRAAPPLILDTPLIIDWTGAKLSKSLDVKDKYEYLKKNRMGYILSLNEMRREGKSLGPLFQLVEDWVDHPKKLFRPYSIGYIHSQYEPHAGKINLTFGEPKATSAAIPGILKVEDENRKIVNVEDGDDSGKKYHPISSPLCR